MYITILNDICIPLEGMFALPICIFSVCVIAWSIYHGDMTVALFTLILWVLSLIILGCGFIMSSNIVPSGSFTDVFNNTITTLNSMR